MSSLFLTVLNMSITSCYVILIIIAARFLLRPAPKKFSYMLWAAAGFRLLCPFTVKSPFSIVPAGLTTGFESFKDIPAGVIPSFSSDAALSAMAGAQTANAAGAANAARLSGIRGSSAGAGSLTDAAGSFLDGLTSHGVTAFIPENILSVLSAIWCIGAAALIVYAGISTLMLKKHLAEATLCNACALSAGQANQTVRAARTKIYETDYIRSPFVFGIISPKIYLPYGLSESEKNYITAHEQTHIDRFDHLTKLLAFIVLCIHWFNPLVWLAFYFMNCDMEKSCDEKVLSAMDTDIRKEYSVSLLSISAGAGGSKGHGRYMFASPLAFSENNVKGRIKNILSYKKPALWIIVLAVVIGAAVVIGLVSDPAGKKDAQSMSDTIFDDINACAESVMDADIEDLESRNEYKIIDKRITKLEQLFSSDTLLGDGKIVEAYLLEYRLLPDDPDKVALPGGMSMEDGWICETSGMGSPVLIVSQTDDDRIKYLGLSYTGEGWDSNDAVYREASMRAFLEKQGLIARETFPGEHTMVSFTASTGETWKLLLSQPARQGEGGIWCVERWLDGAGSVYYAIPDSYYLAASATYSSIEGYYKALQESAGNGQRPSLLDPEETAYEYITADLGHPSYLVPMSSLEVKTNATIEEFYAPPLNYFMGYIFAFTDDKSYFHLDRIEWITSDQTDRLAQLNIDPNDLPNGYYIYNSYVEADYKDTNKDTEYYLLDSASTSDASGSADGSDSGSHKKVTRKEFREYLDSFTDSEFRPLFRIWEQSGYVTKIEEQYQP